MGATKNVNDAVQLASPPQDDNYQSVWDSVADDLEALVSSPDIGDDYTFECPTRGCAL